MGICEERMIFVGDANHWQSWESGIQCLSFCGTWKYPGQKNLTASTVKMICHLLDSKLKLFLI